MDRSSARQSAVKWVLGSLAFVVGLIVLVIVVAVLVDANRFRAPIARLISARTGRQIRIGGDLKFHLLSLAPSAVAEDVSIGNPPWMPPGQTAEIGELSFSVELLRLFAGSFVIHRLEMDGTTLTLAREADGRANWQAHAPDESVPKGPPLMHSLLMPRAHVVLDDARRHLKFDGTISTHDVEGTGGTQPLRIDGEGDLNGHPVNFVINGDPLQNVRRKVPYGFSFVERSSGSRLSGAGSMPRPFDFRHLQTTFEAAGADLKDLYYLIGLSLPNTGSYRFSGKLARAGTHFTYTDLLLTSGESDMRGTISIENSSGRPKIEAELNSQLLRLQDLGERAAGRAAAPSAAKPLLLPDTALRLVGLRRDDAVVAFHARTFDVGHTVLHAVAVQVTIEHGVLTAAPMSADFPAGRISGRVRFDASREVPAGDLDIKITDLRLDQFDHKAGGQPPFDGLLQARLALKGHGRSIHELAAGSNGTLTAVLPHGAIRDSFAEMTGIDVTRSLGLMLRKDHDETAVRCGIASFQVRDGTVDTQTLVIDTEPVLITGKGEIHLDSEVLNLAIRGRPKSWRLVRVRSPVMIRGTLAHPTVGIDARNSLAQVGEAAALGIVLTPLAALLAFVDPGLAKDADCAALLEQAKGDGARTNAAPAVH